jgi:hypothetical protein
MLSCFLFTRLNGISPPSPIVGNPTFLSPKFSAGSGSFIFEIDVPSKWGLGNFSVSPDGSAYFELYPKTGGNGCIIEIQRYNANDQAANALNKFRNKFKNTKALDDGFEAELSQAWFSCRIKGQFLIQTWYSLPKKSSKHKDHWKNLKNCINVLNVEDSIDKTPESLPHEPIKKMIDGWRFNHPTKEQFVLFETHFGGSLRNDEAFSYLISFDDITTNASGFFYIEWDQSDLEITNPYQNLAEKIFKEMKAIDPNQSFDPIKIIPEEGYAIMPGHPYGIVVVSGDNFLFGFAVKRLMDFKDVNVSALLDKVKWSVPK